VVQGVLINAAVLQWAGCVGHCLRCTFWVPGMLALVVAWPCCHMPGHWAFLCAL